MPAYIRGEKRDQLRFVQINPVFCYGWRTRDLASATGISAADLKTQLGHLTAAEADAITNRIMVTGANSPKPARYKKAASTVSTTAVAAVTTFADYNVGVAATTAGWILVSNKRTPVLRPPVTGKRSCTAVATLSNNLLYAFPMNLDDFQLVQADLGLQAASQITSTEKQRICTGSRTKPGKMSLEDSGGILTSFYSTASYDTAIQAGFSEVKSEMIEYAAPVQGPAPAP